MPLPSIRFASALLLLILASCNGFIANKGLSLRGRMASSLSMALKGKLLIVQNKGGGHGTIGYYLCKSFKAANPDVDVFVLQDKCNMKKMPFSSYPELESAGVKIVEGSLTGASASSDLPSGIKDVKFDYIVDNWSKNVQNASFVIDIAKASDSKQLTFISSAGMYKTSGLTPIVEEDPVKENDARKVELKIIESAVPYTMLRPQYIYGTKSNKRYLDFFIGRAHRKLHTPLPLSGEQLVCLTHVEDVASLITAAVGNDRAVNQIFNCGSDRYVSYKGLSQIIHKKLGNADADMKYMYYEPKDFDHWDGSGVMEFPFRRETFITSPGKAKLLLGWKPKHSVEGDMEAEIKDYEALGGFKEEWGVGELKYDLEIIASKDASFMFDYAFLEDPLVKN